MGRGRAVLERRRQWINGVSGGHLSLGIKFVGEVCAPVSKLVAEPEQAHAHVPGAAIELLIGGRVRKRVISGSLVERGANRLLQAVGVVEGPAAGLLADSIHGGVLRAGLSSEVAYRLYVLAGAGLEGRVRGGVKHRIPLEA